MRFCLRVVNGQCPRGVGLRLWDGLAVGNIGVVSEDIVILRQTYIGQRVVGIFLNGLLEIVPPFVQSLRRALVPVVAALAVELVSLGIGGPPGIQFGLLLAGAPLAETRGDFSRNLALHAERVGQVAVILLAPQVAV